MSNTHVSISRSKAKEIFAVGFTFFWCVAGAAIVYNKEKEPSVEQQIFTQYQAKEKENHEKLTKEQLTRPDIYALQAAQAKANTPKKDSTVIASE